jgi:FHA domain
MFEIENRLRRLRYKDVAGVRFPLGLAVPEPVTVGVTARPSDKEQHVSNKDWRVEGLPRGSALLVVKRGPNAGSRFLLDRPVTSAGRHADNDIVLHDITVSQHHAEFRRENRTFQVVDVDSLDGTYVNRELVDSAVLANGDEIQMGKFRLVFLTTTA